MLLWVVGRWRRMTFAWSPGNRASTKEETKESINTDVKRKEKKTKKVEVVK